MCIPVKTGQSFGKPSSNICRTHNSSDSAQTKFGSELGTGIKWGVFYLPKIYQMGQSGWWSLWRQVLVWILSSQVGESVFQFANWETSPNPSHSPAKAVLGVVGECGLEGEFSIAKCPRHRGGVRSRSDEVVMECEGRVKLRGSMDRKGESGRSWESGVETGWSSRGKDQGPVTGQSRSLGAGGGSQFAPSCYQRTKKGTAQKVRSWRAFLSWFAFAYGGLLGPGEGTEEGSWEMWPSGPRGFSSKSHRSTKVL